MIVQTTIDVDAPVATVWQLFGEQFGEIADWASSIERSRLDRGLGEGAVRTCDLVATGPFPASVVTEELTTFDRDAHRLTYLVLSGLPGMMKRVENAWSLDDLGGGRTRITSRLDFRLAWWALPMVPVVNNQMKSALRGFVGELQAHTEGAARAAAAVS